MHRTHIFLLLTLCLSLPLAAQEPTTEFGPTACIDGIDNDGDGLIDCQDPDCAESTTIGCDICPDPISYADVTLDYQPGCPVVDPEPSGAVGAGDWNGTGMDGPEIVFLGQGGRLKLGFTNNVLTNSGADGARDLYVFEVGPVNLVEDCIISLRPEDDATLVILQAEGVPDPEGDGYFVVGTIAGSDRTVDIDLAVPGYPGGALRFDAVEILDVDANVCSGGTPGADIDAVCALTTLPAPDCNGVTGGTAVIDECGECLDISDPAFNQSCQDCAGVPNGLASVDSCGVCNLEDDPERNESCRDCEGILDGGKVMDECGQCLLPSDPEFNRPCADCNNVPNGGGVIDRCGVCLPPDDPRFGITCGDPNQIYAPTAFTPNLDGINDAFVLAAPAGTTPRLLSLRIHDRWGAVVYELTDVPLTEGVNWWDGTVRGQRAAAGLYAYAAEVVFADGTSKLFTGGVHLLR